MCGAVVLLNVSSILRKLLQSTGRVNIQGSARVTSVQTKSDNESKMIVTVMRRK
jgi:hypothetical protein